MRRVHSGNHGLHKIKFWRKHYFEGGGLFYSLLALALTLLILSLVWGVFHHGWESP